MKRGAAKEMTCGGVAVTAVSGIHGGYDVFLLLVPGKG
jgi:hypothetical protein